jgi:glycosyltransferase EpsE
MCDDGSKDNTIDVAQQYVDRYTGKFILIKNEKNMGLNFTLNHCLEYADTEYTARMDGDDLSLPHRFEQEIRFLDEHPEYAIVSGPMIYFDENGDFRTGKGGYEPQKEDYINGRTFCHAPCMIRTIAYKAVDGYTISKYLLRLEDQHLWLKMYKAGYRGYNLEEPIYKMRDDRNAVSRRDFITRRNEMLHRLRICKTFKLPWYKYIQSLIIPFIKWVMPTKLYKLYHRNR